MTEPRKKELEQADRKGKVLGKSKAREKTEKKLHDNKGEEAPMRGLGFLFDWTTLAIPDLTSTAVQKFTSPGEPKRQVTLRHLDPSLEECWSSISTA